MRPSHSSEPASLSPDRAARLLALEYFVEIATGPAKTVHQE